MTRIIAIAPAVMSNAVPRGAADPGCASSTRFPDGSIWAPTTQSKGKQTASIPA